MKMQFRIHTNGQTRDAFIKQQSDLRDALAVLRSTLRAAMPHRRDYPQGNEALREDMYMFINTDMILVEVKALLDAREARILELDK